MNLAKITALKKVALWVKENPSPPRILGTIFVILSLLFGIFWAAGYDVEPITFLLSLFATVCFALPAVADLLIARKPISQMNYEDVLKFIETSDAEKDWKSISSDENEDVFCLHDTRLRIRHCIGDSGTQNEKFKNTWANKFPDPSACGLWYEVVLNGDIIKREVIVAVDGFRAHIPCPKFPNLTITGFQDKIGRIIAASPDRYEEYKTRIGISVTRSNTIHDT